MTNQNRRSFLKAIGLGSAGSLVSTQLIANPTQPSRNQKHPSTISITIKGAVRCAGIGVANVAVTDGLTVTTTDSKGNYELQSNATATFVYISIPRGYAFHNEKGIVSFYKRINTSRSRFRADFTLEKLTQDDTQHTFVVWADTQIETAEDAKRLLQESAPDLRKLVADYGPTTLMHGIGCGDLIWDNYDLYEDYKKAIEIGNIPFFQVLGNHDVNHEARSEEHSSNTFSEHFGPTYYSFNRGEIHYVILDDVFYLGAFSKYTPYISERQFHWLEQDLALVKPGSTVVLSLHIPTTDISNREELYRILKPYKVQIMSGHNHSNTKIFITENITEHNHGAVCGAWWIGNVCYEGTPNGYGVYEVNGSEIRWYHKSVGYAGDHQVRLYAPGSDPEHPYAWIANVWNWDPAWKVEWFEDDAYKGTLKNEHGYDPTTLTLFAKDKLPDSRQWISPGSSDHIFRAIPSPTVKKITIRVTDRFGNVYNESLNL
jgi:hypothetical protein